MRPVERAVAAARVPLIRNSFALIVNTGLNGALGFAYWLVAARLYSPHHVGTGAAGISALLLAASIGWTGFQYTLMRYLADSGGRSARLVAASYGVALLIAGPAAIAFIAYAQGVPELREIAGSWLAAAGFIAGVCVWVVFSLQDAALIGLRRSAWVPAENAAYGILKLVLLVLLAALGSGWGLIASWVAGAAVMVAVVNVLLFTRLLVGRPHRPDRLPATGTVVRFTAGHHLVALVGGLPDNLVPLLVVSLLSDQANAYYYAAWTVSYSMRLVAMNIANALTVEGAHDQDEFHRLVRSGMRLGLLVIGPILLAALVLAPLVMRLFGSGYDTAVPLLRLFAIALAPFTATTLFVATERVSQRVGAAAAVMVTSTALTVGLDVLLVPRLGIAGAGLGWLVAQFAAAAVAGLVVLRRAILARAAGRANEGAPAVRRGGRPVPRLQGDRQSR